MAVNDLILFRKGTAAQWSAANPVLASGEPGYDLTNKIFKIGDGVSNWSSLVSINLTSSNITNFNSAVSGLLSVTNIIPGSNISISSASGVYTINSTGGGSIADPYDLGTYPLITISSQPSSQTVGLNANVTFSVTAAATSPSASIAYQWQLSTNSGSTWTNISGATSSSLALTNVQSGSNNNQYRCLLTANLSSIASNAATLTVIFFQPQAVLLTSGTSYTVPAGASSMKAWAVGGGGGTTSSSGAIGGQAGGVAFKTWTVSGGQTVAYSAAAVPASGRGGSNSTVTFSGVTITGFGGVAGAGTSAGGFSGGDGGATGGGQVGSLGPASLNARGGAVGGNGTSVASCGRQPASDVSGLFAALALAGVATTESCGATAAFGSGGYRGKYVDVAAGIGGGGGGASYLSNSGTGGAVVLYFT